MGDSFEYSYVVDVEPNSIRNGFCCKNGLARVRDRVLRNWIFRQTTIFSFRCDDKNANFWHNTCLGSVRKNMLSIIGASKRKKDGALIIITEKVTKSMRQWCSGKTLVRRVVNDVVLPSDDFGAAMRGILAGVIQAKKLGGNAKITVDDTFFVEGIAKISIITQCSTDPMLQFVDMMKNILGNADDIPKELFWFLYLLEQKKSNDAFCRQLSKHPSLYKMEIRLNYRSIAYKKVKFLRCPDCTNLHKKFISIQEQLIRKHKVSKNWATSLQDSEVFWKQNIEAGYPPNSPFREALSPRVHLNVASYTDAPLCFLRYGRNLHQHPGNLTYLEIEVELTKMWPDFIPCLHEAFRECSIRVEVNDEMDNIRP